MSKITVIRSVQSVEEFEELLGKYEMENPAKFAIKKANGEFDRFRAKLKSNAPVKPIKVEIVEEKVAEEAVAPHRGRPAKYEEK